MVNNVTLVDVLDRTENIKLAREFKYIEQAGIKGKPSIIAGGDALKRYPLNLKLHSDFCNPQKIIDEVEEKGSSRQPIQYFQGSKYIGAYVIENYNSNIVQKFGDVVIYAELELTLLEDEKHNEEFKTQDVKAVDLSEMASFSESSPNVQGIVSGSDVLDSALDNVLTDTTSGLSGVEKTLTENLTNNIVNEVKNAGITSIFSATNDALSTVNSTTSLTSEQSSVLQESISDIPKSVLTSYLR